MARNLSSRCKLSRRVGTDIGLIQRGGRDIETKCKLTTPPGQHGSKKGRKSDYGLMLQAKQMLRLTYGVLEKQFRRYYKEAVRQKGATGEVLLTLLEQRLDNVVYRMGFASTRAEARQLVSHKAIVVANQATPELSRVINIPSYLVSPGETVMIRERSKSQERIKDALKLAQSQGFVEWVDTDVEGQKAVFKRIPERSELPSEYREQDIVEYYSK